MQQRCPSILVLQTEENMFVRHRLGCVIWYKTHTTIILTVIVVAILLWWWSFLCHNFHFHWRQKISKSWKLDICWGLYQTNVFPYTWRTRFVGQGISAGLQYFIILSHILSLSRTCRVMQFGYCTRPNCDFHHIAINCAPLVQTPTNATLSYIHIYFF